MNDQVSMTGLLRETYMPLIRQALPDGPPQGEMRWLVNKCGTQHYRVRQHGRKPISDTLIITQGVPHVLSETRWCGKFVNSRSGNVYFISFETEK